MQVDNADDRADSPNLSSPNFLWVSRYLTKLLKPNIFGIVD